MRGRFPRGAGAPPRAPPPLDAPDNFINRELSWLEFNARVLHQGLDPDVPLLERLNFLAIVSSNLDEFYMVRVGGLQQQVRAGLRKRDPSGLSAPEQLGMIATRVRAIVERAYDCLNRELLPALARNGIIRLRPGALSRRDLAVAERYFREDVFPALTPLALEDDGGFPHVPGLTLHLAVRLRPKGARSGETRIAFIPLPRSWPRFFRIPSESGFQYLLLEELVAHFADCFFEGHEVLEAAAFRLTRDADLPIEEEEVVDFLEAVEELLRARKEGVPVRLEIEAHASDELVRQLAAGFRITPKEDLFRVAGPLDLKAFMRLAAQVDAPSLHYPPFDPQPVTAFDEADTPWEVIRERDVLVHHPYESFASVVDLLRAAADDPHVVALKQTLYRTSEDSPIVDALERAAQSGKQVTVLVELKARFDEAQNIARARRLIEAGAQVVYGVVGLKTHAKLSMVVRREADGVRRYLHLATGNYNDVTARRYEDFGLFTCDPEFGADASNFFNAITGYSEPRDWRQLVIAPTGLRERLLTLIDREIERSSAATPGRIVLKMNSLVDPEMVARLYLASQRGVRVRLCVRGICCLRPGVRGLSHNIEVISVVGRFLEHSRVFYFHNGGDQEVYLSSADFMPRNLDRRLELMFPVRDEANRRRVIGVLETLFEDNRNAWRLRPDGTYERLVPKKAQPSRAAQQVLMEQAFARAEASRIRRLSSFRPQGPGMAPGLRR